MYASLSISQRFSPQLASQQRPERLAHALDHGRPLHLQWSSPVNALVSKKEQPWCFASSGGRRVVTMERGLLAHSSLCPLSVPHPLIQDPRKHLPHITHHTYYSVICAFHSAAFLCNCILPITMQEPHPLSRPYWRTLSTAVPINTYPPAFSISSTIPHIPAAFSPSDLLTPLLTSSFTSLAHLLMWPPCTVSDDLINLQPHAAPWSMCSFHWSFTSTSLGPHKTRIGRKGMGNGEWECPYTSCILSGTETLMYYQYTVIYFNTKLVPFLCMLLRLLAAFTQCKPVKTSFWRLGFCHLVFATCTSPNSSFNQPVLSTVSHQLKECQKNVLWQLPHLSLCVYLSWRC